MNYSNLFKIAMRAIAANKLRSFLTMLGIIIGVASVIAMMAIGQGSKKSIQANIAEMGSNMIMIRPGQDKGPGGAQQDASDMQTLKLKDYEALKEQAKYLSAISPSVILLASLSMAIITPRRPFMAYHQIICKSDSKRSRTVRCLLTRRCAAVQRSA